MSYPEDVKMQPPVYDEEQGVSDRSRLAGWVPVSEDHMEKMRSRDAKMKKRLRAVRLTVRIAAFILAVFMLYSQVYMLNKYYTTRGIMRDGRNAWAKETVLWPTWVLLVTSGLTVVVTAITIVSYLWGVKKANWSATRIYAPWVGVEVAAHLAVWIGATVAYRVGKTGNDLWGWTCDPRAEKIQINFGEVNFDFSCGLQTDAWAVSIAQAALMLVVGVSWFLAWRRNKHKKNINYRESLMMNTEYGPKADVHMMPQGPVPHPGQY